MACRASEYVKVLQGWIGKKESDGSHKVIVDTYNRVKPLPRGYKVKYTDAWCATTNSAAAIECNATDICPIECGCGEVIRIAKEMGIWIENENRVPTIGEWCLYDWDDGADFKVTDNQGYPEHIGTVESIDTARGKFIVIEGNYSDSVKRRELDINGRYIRGFVAPKYLPEEVPAPKPSAPINTGNKVIGTAVAKESMKVRDGATTVGTKTVGYIDKGQKVEVLEVLSNGWYKIVWKNGIAYTSNAGNKYYTYTAKGTSTPTPATQYYPKYTGNDYRVDKVFEAIGVPTQYCGGYKKRKPIASANNIGNYTGSYEQNVKLISLAKQGKLMKP